ncbi:MAG: ABC transporter substrate-binding protein [Micromonosporaceae bacterium]
MFRRTPRILAAVLTVAALALSGCAGDARDDNPTPTGSGDAAFPVTVGELTLDKRPERIVSLAPVATETLFAIGAGAQVVAVDEMSNYPPEAPRTTLSGYKPNAEAIAGYAPDLVVISNDMDNISASLATLKIPVYLAPAAQTLDDVYAQIEDFGKLTGHADEAADLTRRMRDEIAKLVGDLPERSKKLTYFYELDPTLYTVTSKTFVGSLFALAGLENVADPSDTTGSGYPQLSAEALVKANPDLIFLADTKCCGQSPETVKARPGWADITAVRTGQIIVLDDDIASRWGPRVTDLVRAITEAVAKVPEA